MRKRSFGLCAVSLAAALTIPLLPKGACGAPGDLYVSEGTSGTIFKFSADGTKTTFASALAAPAGLAFDREGNLLVAERDSGTILKFTPDGIKSTFISGLSSPSALAFDGMANLFVTESFATSGSISKFTPAGVKEAFADGNKFVDLALDIFGNLYAAYDESLAMPAGMMLFSPTGLANYFVEPARLVAIGSSGNIFTTWGGQILEYTPYASKTEFAFGPQNPGGLAFDVAGNLFVTDLSAGTVLKFTSAGTQSTFVSGLIEPSYLVFEPVTEKLRNLSARGLVGTGDNVLIGGFIVGGNALSTNTVVIRALGPSLAQSEVTNPLTNPVLELRNSTGAIVASNDDWQQSPQAYQISASDLAPTDPKESAILVMLPGGAYTAIVHGMSDTLGVALVEVYSIGP